MRYEGMTDIRERFALGFNAWGDSPEIDGRIVIMDDDLEDLIVDADSTEGTPISNILTEEEVCQLRRDAILYVETLRDEGYSIYSIKPEKSMGDVCLVDIKAKSVKADLLETDDAQTVEAIIGFILGLRVHRDAANVERNKKIPCRKCGSTRYSCAHSSHYCFPPSNRR